ncbi:PREDICTED: defensin-like protein 301 [Camelina sativa]|uniref:Defensin-like protein 301 n=1 Tax=Camelina sativa TaxID=90675 RepID=A0ABM1R7D1_CAMSA|nr:PREDICTED: defensin-like protein 301 [Camelina sativa]
MRSEGQFRCKSAKDCDPRGCRLWMHVICNKLHKCTCANGAPIGGQCNSIKDCYLSGCPPNSHVVCDRQICTCVS